MKHRAIIPLAFAASLLGTGAQAGCTYDDIATVFNLGPTEELVAAIETCTTQGTDWSQVTLIGQPIMMAAIRDGNLPAIDALHLAALLGYPEVVQAILDTGLSADLPDAAGRGPIAMLLWPVCRAEVGIILIENGATLGTIPIDLHERFLEHVSTVCAENEHYPDLAAALKALQP